MVDLQAIPHVAAGDHACRVTSLQRGAQVGGNRPPGVGHRHHVDALGHHHLEHPVVGQSPGGGHGDGPDAGDVAHLALLGVAPHPGRMIDPHRHRRRGARPPPPGPAPPGRRRHRPRRTPADPRAGPRRRPAADGAPGPPAPWPRRRDTAGPPSGTPPRRRSSGAGSGSCAPSRSPPLRPRPRPASPDTVPATPAATRTRPPPPAPPPSPDDHRPWRRSRSPGPGTASPTAAPPRWPAATPAAGPSPTPPPPSAPTNRDCSATKWAAERLPDPCHARVASTRPAASALPAAAKRSISPNRRNASTAAGPSRQPDRNPTPSRPTTTRSLPVHRTAALPTCSHAIEHTFGCQATERKFFAQSAARDTRTYGSGLPAVPVMGEV